VPLVKAQLKLALAPQYARIAQSIGTFKTNKNNSKITRNTKMKNPKQNNRNAKPKPQSQHPAACTPQTPSSSSGSNPIPMHLLAAPWALGTDSGILTTRRLGFELAHSHPRMVFCSIIVQFFIQDPNWNKNAANCTCTKLGHMHMHVPRLFLRTKTARYIGAGSASRVAGFSNRLVIRSFLCAFALYLSIPLFFLLLSFLSLGFSIFGQATTPIQN
jgi:hypothetical protein